MKRWLPFLLFGLALVGMGLVLSNFASDQAGKLADGAPGEAAAAPDEAQVAACASAQAHYDELWDQSLENPEDVEKEEELGVALGELYAACEASEAVELDGADADANEDAGSNEGSIAE